MSLIEQKTYVDQVEVTFGGVLQIRCKKALFRDGREIGFEYHRTVVPPDGDHLKQLEIMNAHLMQMGEAAVSAEDWGKRVGALVPVVHTDEIKAAHARLLKAMESRNG